MWADPQVAEWLVAAAMVPVMAVLVLVQTYALRMRRCLLVASKD